VINIVLEVALAELGKLNKLVVMELDNNKSKSCNKDIYTVFKVIEVENRKALYKKLYDLG
jgi:hypothetical protein